MSNHIDTSPAALRIRAALLAIAAEKEAQQPRPTDDELWDDALSDRDRYHDIADKLANAIAAHLGIDIGEHSNRNCPWLVALEALEQHHCEQPLAMVAPADVPLPEPDWALDFAPNAEVYHAPVVQKLVNEAAHQYAEAYANAKLAAERERMAQWVRDNYQDYASVAGLCEAIRANQKGAV